MFYRLITAAAVSLVATYGLAAPLPPTPEATSELSAALDAYAALQDEVQKLMALSQQENSDHAEAMVITQQMTASTEQMKRHLEKAAAGGHAVAILFKARLLFGDNPLKNKAATCELYGDAAALGLTAGALEYAKCAYSYPPTVELQRRLSILESVLAENDPYSTDYPLPTVFPYCYPKHKPALKPDEDPIAWIQDNAKPQALSLEDFKAEGYYALAMMSPLPNVRAREFLASAFAHGCREDSAWLRNIFK